MVLSQSKESIDFFTQQQLTTQLLNLGIVKGDVIEVHASLKSIGYILGGAQTLLDAILEVIGLEGTLVMAAQSWGNSEPAFFQNPPIEVEKFQTLRDSHPAYRQKQEDFRFMGELVKAMQLRPNSYVSNHPNYGFIAIGKYAKWLTQSHALSDGLGMNSPLGKCLELRSKIVLIGVDYDRATGLHLGEHLSGYRPYQLQGARIFDKGVSLWTRYLDIDYDSDDFLQVGKILEEKELVRFGSLGRAKVKLFKLQESTAITQAYFEALK